MHRKLKIAVLLCSLFLLVLVFFVSAFANTVKTGEIAGDSVRIRSAPNASSLENILTSYNTGKVVVILGDSGDYYKIEYKEGAAYVFKSLVTNIKTQEAVQTSTASNSITGTVTAGSVNVREKPNTSDYTRVVGKLNSGDKVNIVDKTISGWYGVSYNGKTCWISSQYVSIDQNIEQDSNDFGLYEDGQNAIVTGTTLNMRSEPDPNADNIVYVLSKGMRIELLETKDNWYKVNYGLYEGWVFGDYIMVETSYIFAEAKIGKNYSGVNFREQPNTKAETISKLNAGTEFLVVGGYDKWCKVIYQEKTGWIYAKYVDITEASIMTPGYIIADRVNFRDTDTTDSKVLGLLNEDTKIWVIDQKSEWYCTFAVCPA